MDNDVMITLMEMGNRIALLEERESFIVKCMEGMVNANLMMAVQFITVNKHLEDLKSENAKLEERIVELEADVAMYHEE